MCAVRTVDVCGPETTFWNPKAPWKRWLRSELREHLCSLVVHPTLNFLLWQIFRYLMNIYSSATSVHLAPNCMQTILSRLCSVCCKKEAKLMRAVVKARLHLSRVDRVTLSGRPRPGIFLFTAGLWPSELQIWPAFPDAGMEYSFHNSNSSGI